MNIYIRLLSVLAVAGAIIFPCAFTAVAAAEPPGLVGCWKFDESGGAVVKDSSGNGIDGQLKGFENMDVISGEEAVSGRVKGRIGNAVAFDGNDDYIIIPDKGGALNLREAFTVSMWLKPLLAKARPFVPMTVISKGDPANPGGAWRIYFNEPTRNVDDVFAPAGFFVEMRKAGDNDPDPELNYVTHPWPCAIRDRWYHFTFTFDGQAGLPLGRIYADGVEISRKEYVAPDGAALLQAIKTNNLALEIGGLNGGACFCGLIDEVKIWNRSLSPAEIQAEFRRAGDPPGPTLDLFANFETIGVTARISPASDPEGDAVASLEYREQGQAEYRQGFALSRTLFTESEYQPDGICICYVGSIFWLDENKAYDVRVVFSDPTTKGKGSLDGVVLQGSIKTRAEKDIASPAAINAYFVSPNGSGAKFSLTEPGALKDALTKAGPGDQVILKGGIYYEGDICLSRSGAPGKPIVIKGNDGETAVLDGSAPEPLKDWLPCEGNTYKYNKPLDKQLLTSELVVADGRRLIQYYSLEGLKALKFTAEYRPETEPGPGFFIDDKTSILYVNLGGANPNDREMRISRYHHGFMLSRADFIHVENLTFRYYNMEPRIGPAEIRRLAVQLRKWKNFDSKGIAKLSSFNGPANIVPKTIWYDFDFPKALFILNSSDCVVRKCRFQVNKVGLCVMGRSYRTVIEDNEFFDTTGDLGFSRMKATWMECGAGVHVHSPYSGRGLVMRRNTTHDTGDGGQVTGYNAAPINIAGVSDETDVHDNLFYNSSDDSLEIDGIACNVRLWRNIFKDGLTGMSFSPTRHGPVYAIRNVAYETDARRKVQGSTRMFKVLSYGRRGPMFFLHNTSYMNEGFMAIGRGGVTLSKDGHPRVTWDYLDARNNIFYAKFSKAVDIDLRNNDGGPMSLDYNDYYRKAEVLFGTWNGEKTDDLLQFRKISGREKHGLSVDPGFADAANGNFRLKAGGPMIDAGVLIPGINDNYKGKGPDIGAFEYETEK